MTTRREFMGYLPAAGAAFAVAGNVLLGEGPARAQDAAAPLEGHFHPKGKAPSKFTLEALQRAKETLPFADQRDFEELARGFIAPMPDLKIMADAGHVAWDMERFQFLNEDRDFDSIHPSLLRQSRLNNNYGLYEVIPGIYQVRGVDLSDITFVRGKTGWIVFDPLVSEEPVRAAWKLFQEHVGEGLPVTAVIYSHTHGDHWGGVRGLIDEADVRSGKVALIAPVDFMDFTISENVYAGNAMNRRLFYQYGLLLPASPHGYVGQGLGQGVSAGATGLIAPNRHVSGGDRGVRGRRRPHDLPEHAEHRSAAGDEHLHPRPQGAVDGGERHRLAPQHLHAPRRAGARPASLVEIHQRVALPLRPGGGGDVRLPPLAALGQRAHPGSAPRPARPLCAHEQPGAPPCQPGCHHQPDPQCLQPAAEHSPEVALPRLSRLPAAQQPRRDPALSRLLGHQPDDADPAVAGGFGAALCRDDGRLGEDPRPRPGTP